MSLKHTVRRGSKLDKVNVNKEDSTELFKKIAFNFYKWHSNVPSMFLNA